MSESGAACYDATMIAHRKTLLTLEEKVGHVVLFSWGFSMKEPQTNIIREHPRKFMLAGIACAAINPPSLVATLPFMVYAFMCWIDGDRFNALQKNAWDRYYAQLDSIPEEEFGRIGNRIQAQKARYRAEQLQYQEAREAELRTTPHEQYVKQMRASGRSDIADRAEKSDMTVRY